MSDLARAYGLTLDPWQEDVLRAGLGERSNGDWAVRQVGLSTPRQNGKTQLIVARVLAGLLLFDEQTIIVSAHRQDTARETFFRLVQIIEDTPALEERVDFIGRSEMREYIRMKSGQTVRFKSRANGSGRGFACDCLMLDEAQDLSEASWASILPTLSARPNPQVWLLGTPPTELDDGEVFGRIRAAGLERKASRLAYLEWSAEPDDDFDDPDVWAKANPALGIRISMEAIEAERAVMSDAQFGRERLGIWDVTQRRYVIPADAWERQGDELSVAVDRFTLGVEVAADLVRASVALAGLRPDGEWHIELAERRDGVGWLAPFLERLLAANPQIRGVVTDVGGPVSALLEQKAGRWVFRGTRLQVTPLRVSEVGAACSLVLDGIVAGWLRHTRQPQLTSSVMVAGKRQIADTGKWAWARGDGVTDITPTQAVTWALWGARGDSVRRPARRTTDGGRRVVTG